MSITQIVGLAVGILALLLSSELVRSMAARHKRPLQVDAGFRRVGTFGVLTHVSPQTSPLPSTGSAGRSLIVIFGLALFLATGIVVKIAWDRTHPDIRSAYGRAYERCVGQGVSRWN